MSDVFRDHWGGFSLAVLLSLGGGVNIVLIGIVNAHIEDGTAVQVRYERWLPSALWQWDKAHGKHTGQRTAEN